MKFITSIIGLLAITGVSCGNPCKGFFKQDLIQSGLIQLSNTVTYKDTCYSIPIDYQIPKSGVKSIVACGNMEGLVDRNGADYSVRMRRKNNNNAINIYLSVRDKLWRKISVSYLIASRQDILLGSFIADTFGGFGCDGLATQPYEIRQAIPDVPITKNYNAIAYISGIKASKQFSNLKISNQNYDPRKSLLSIKIQADSNIEHVHISYVLYRPDTSQFRIYRPTDIVEVDYSIEAVFAFTKSKHVTEIFGIIVDRRQCVGSGCLNACVNRIGCLSLKGVYSDKSCLVCGKNEVAAQGKCVCSPGFVIVGKNCVKPCPENQVYNQFERCDCKAGLARLGGICQQCPANSKLVGDKCICNTDYKWDDIKFLCNRPVALPPVLPAICPPRSNWNPALLTCQCTVQDEHLINFKCDKCPSGENWNGKACICKAGLFRVNQVCRTCDINTSYDGNNCVCNWGFYGNANKCQKCHVTCGKCKGPDANQCLACAEVYLTLKDGYCYRQNNCPPGFYVDQTCKQCPSYCASCKSDTLCTSCITGFKLQSAKLDTGDNVQYCTEICGDGRRFEDECDDGNTRSNDGCSSECKVEQGYTCQGATTAKPSICTKSSQNKAVITPTASAQFSGKVVQGIRLSYIPPELTANECFSCFKLLQVKVISSAIVPTVQLNYIPKSQYQFYCTFDFYGLFAIPIFTISIQINPEFAKYFSAADMAQIQVKQIDPALLAKNDLVQTLSLDEDPQAGNQQIQDFIVNNS